MRITFIILLSLLSSTLFCQEEEYHIYAQNEEKSEFWEIRNGDKLIVKLSGGHKAKGELEILSETNIKVGASIVSIDAIKVLSYSTPSQYRWTNTSKNICLISAGVGIGVFTAGLINANNTSGLDFSGITLMAFGAGMTTVGLIGGSVINTQKYRHKSLRKSQGWSFKIQKS